MKGLGAKRNWRWRSNTGDWVSSGIDVEVRGTVCYVFGVVRVEGVLGEWGGRGLGEIRVGGDNVRLGWRIRLVNVFKCLLYFK